MDSKTRRGGSAPRVAALMLAGACAVSVAYAYAYAAGKGGTAAPPAAQDLIRVESRLTQLEQRILSIETSVRGLEQQARLADMSRPAAARDAEVALLRSQLEATERRLAEVECGLSKLDERTLTPTAREARRQSGASADDPCRINPTTPLRLSSRP